MFERYSSGKERERQRLQCSSGKRSAKCRGYEERITESHPGSLHFAEEPKTDWRDAEKQGRRADGGSNAKICVVGECQSFRKRERDKRKSETSGSQRDHVDTCR